jgi:hypothetical protein
VLTWVALGKDRYRVTFKDEVWWLKATPEADKPWRLYTEREHQGPADPGQDTGDRRPVI